MSHEVLANFMSLVSDGSQNVRASGSSLAFGSSWNVNFPGYGDRRPNLNKYGERVHRYTTLARISEKGVGCGETAYFPTAQATGQYPADYKAIITTTFTRGIATPIRCQKQQ
jgi:hypothetical protein